MTIPCWLLRAKCSSPEMKKIKHKVDGKGCGTERQRRVYLATNRAGKWTRTASPRPIFSWYNIRKAHRQISCERTLPAGNRTWKPVVREGKGCFYNSQAQGIRARRSSIDVFFSLSVITVLDCYKCFVISSPDICTFFRVDGLLFYL